MGKGYHTHEGIMNADFKTLFEAALARRVRVPPLPARPAHRGCSRDCTTSASSR